MKYFFRAFIIAIYTFASPAFADQDRFDHALQLWLDAEDATAYPLLSELAQEGYEPAMLFLGGLYVQHRNNGYTYIPAIPKEYYDYIVSSEGSENWLDHVVEDQEFAQALAKWSEDRGTNLTNTEINASADAAMQRGLLLAERGEFAHAANVFYDSAPRWEPTEEETLAFVAQDFSDYIKPVQWLVGTGVGRRRYIQPAIKNPVTQLLIAGELTAGLHTRKLNALYFYDHYLRSIDRAYHDSSFADFPENLQDFIYFSDCGFLDIDPFIPSDLAHMREFEQILLNDDFVKPLVEYCTKTCPGEIGNCTGLLYTALGGYDGLRRNHSPLQSVISDEIYFASAQFEASLRTRGLYYDLVAEDLELSACTAALATELAGNE